MIWALRLGSNVLLLVGASHAENVAFRVDKAIKKPAERCAKNPPPPGTTDCILLKLKTG